MRPECRVQAFLASAKIQGAFQPLPSPPLQLTQLDQCRIRDRSTIMARHLFADRGDAFADEQVLHFILLESLLLHRPAFRLLCMQSCMQQYGCNFIILQSRSA